MRTSVRKVSLNSLAPEIWRIGRVSIPGVFISTTTNVSPLCLGTVGSVRTTRMPQSVRCAQLDQTFWPLTIQSSPSRTARVRKLARSEPAEGSEKSWHQVMSPFSVGSIKRARCSSVPCLAMTGSAMPVPIEVNGPLGR